VRMAWPLWAVLLVVAAVTAVGLGQASLWEIDEGVYAGIARYMGETGDYLVPHWNFAPRFDKPPLVLWGMAGAMRLLGPTELAARLPSLLFGLASVALLYLWMRQVKGATAATLASLGLSSCFLFFFICRMAIIDTALTFLMTLALYAFWQARRRSDRRWYWLLGLALGLGTLTKGPVVLGLCGITILGFLGPRRLVRELMTRHALLGGVLTIAVALPWHLAVYRRYGSVFLSDYLGYHMLTRFTTGIEEHGMPWYYYLLVLAIGALPWSVFLPAALRSAVADRHRGEQGELLRLALWWAGSVIGFFSLSATKLPGYILPAFPAVGLVLGHQWDVWLEGRAGGSGRLPAWRGVCALPVIGLLLGVGLCAAGPLVPPGYGDLYRLLFVLPALVTAGGALAAWTLRRWGPKAPAYMAIFSTFIAVYLVFGVALGGRIEQFKPVKPLSLKARELMQPGGTVISLLGDAGAPFYVGRPVQYLSAGEARHALVASPGSLVMVPRPMLQVWEEELPPGTPPPWRAIYEAGGGVLLSNGSE
jgi:4-amino-4-deoxy-L-arabinose transferase-like glycosyltransferase